MNRFNLTLITVLAVLPCSRAAIIVRDRAGNIVPGATSTTLAELTNALASIQIDDKLFEAWRDFASVGSGGAAPADAAQITVVATGEGACDPGPGVRFVSSQFSVGGIAQSQQTMFSYNVRTVSGAPAIDSVALGLGQFQADLAGEVDLTETVRDQSQNLLGTLAIQATSFGVTPPGGTDRLPVVPRSVVSVTKDVLLSNGGPEDQGSAVLAELDQNFSQPCGACQLEVAKTACVLAAGTNAAGASSVPCGLEMPVPPPPPNCEGRVSELQLLYTGGGCEASHSSQG